MLVCAHPAIAPNIRTPLMLQTVLGVEAAAIAVAFAVEPATMAQRLVRAKKRIRDAGIPFVLPERDDLAERLPAVLEAVYGAYAIDWQIAPEARDRVAVRRGAAPGTGAGRAAARRAGGARPGRAGVPRGGATAGAAHRRRRLRPARRAGHRALGRDARSRAESRCCAAPMASGEPGRFQYEAAIQSAHCARARRAASTETRCASCTGRCCAWRRRWVQRWRAAAVDGEIDGPDAGLRALDAITDPAVGRFQPAWTTRAHLLAEAGRAAEAAEAYRRAIELTSDPGVADYLSRRLHEASR